MAARRAALGDLSNVGADAAAQGGVKWDPPPNVRVTRGMRQRALAAEQAEREGAAGGDPAAGDGPTDAQILDAVDAGALDNVPDPTESIEVGGMLG